ncbi:CpaD family pilus assembly lipoprotein [Sphingomonas mucosissima]|uniref:Pilus biogenesis CpaD protein n=1 Tax=Sphingomonas mucosissima TaxID=370959 RepID=A0A245ZEW1_9SPHN|nr:CpaD family pilus assembly lipoprotein [Sphingomonas mucosissima]OWK28287.1 pilus biogenesis CpaD protein [Sphingomonas mucosissima]
MLKRTLLLGMAPALIIGGCSGTANRGLESVHQPVVSRADYAFDVGSGPSGLAPGEGERLVAWMSSLKVGYGDRIAVDDPSRDPATRADVAAAAAQFGLLVSDEATVTAAPIASGTARIVVSRARAYVPGCPDHSRMYEPNFDAHTSSNHGCAVNSNLAAMVANPTDLVRGEAARSPYDPAVATKAIDRFRRAEPTGAGGTAVRAEGTSAGSGGSSGGR